VGKPEVGDHYGQTLIERRQVAITGADNGRVDCSLWMLAVKQRLPRGAAPGRCPESRGACPFDSGRQSLSRSVLDAIHWTNSSSLNDSRILGQACLVSALITCCGYSRKNKAALEPSGCISVMINIYCFQSAESFKNRRYVFFIESIIRHSERTRRSIIKSDCRDTT
jgi:hypothetical protein